MQVVLNVARAMKIEPNIMRRRGMLPGRHVEPEAGTKS